MKDALRNEVCEFVGRHGALRETRPWGAPRVGFVAAEDPGFGELRRLLGPRHSMPRDLMPSAASVVAVFVPYDRDVARANRPGEPVAREWCVTHNEVNGLLVDLGEHLAGWLAGKGHVLTAIPDSHAFDPDRVVADWSHKHVAVLAGLGRPGLHTMLITEQGCVGRVWSYLTDVPLASDPRVEHEPCLRRAGDDCADCVERCVGDALHLEGLDPHACYAQCLRNGGRFPDLAEDDLCGKCAVGVPCSHVDPVARRARSRRR